jgi:hypothetical protein
MFGGKFSNMLIHFWLPTLNHVTISLDLTCKNAFLLLKKTNISLHDCISDFMAIECSGNGLGLGRS